VKGERRRIWIGFIFAVLFTLLAFVSGGCAGNTYTVCPGGGCNYTSIQAAVNASQSGDTIIVRDGTYIENVQVDVANLTLQSENGSAFTTVVAALNSSDVFLVTANSVTITGFTVRNAIDSASGIYLGSVHHCIVSGNNASDNHHGIDLYSSSNNNLTGNTAYSNYRGIYLRYSSNNTLSSNTASNNYYGIYLRYSSNNNTLISNTALNNSYGIYLLDSNNNNRLTDNTASNNWDGIGLYSSSNNNTLISNTASNNSNYGIYLSSSHSNTLSENTASNNTYGIELYSSCNNNTLTSNTANSNYEYGILLDSSCNNNVLRGNTASNNSIRGIYLVYSSNNNNLVENTVSHSGVGIHLYSSSNNNNLVENTVSHSGYGIYLLSSSNNSLSGNTAINNDYGIYLSSSSFNNTLTGNTANSNNYYGIFLKNSPINNLIYNNYFDNMNNAWDSGNNIWNITQTPGTNIIGGSWLGGNYWSDYTGEDTNGDGIGDTSVPYNSSGNIVNGGDCLPLVYPPILDTGEGSYPSISGTFNGTITPSRNLTVNTLYTYSCTGTGGHTKSINLYENDTLRVTGVWSGYQGDWHNITFSEVTLLKNHEYRYVIVIGSYPQIIHADTKDVTGGTITCEEFVDVNGKRHEGWIPAIRLS
jgi:parallel beta-helix repeat protein